MEESILITIKKLLGLTEDYTPFDTDIIVAINTAFNILTQLGVGPKEGFAISDSSSVWGEFIQDTRLMMVKTYVHLQTKLIFDPPMSSAVTEVIKDKVRELEWRINVQVDPGKDVV